VASNGDSYDVVRADPRQVTAAAGVDPARTYAVDLFRQAGLDFEAEKVRARTAGFRP